MKPNEEQEKNFIDRYDNPDNVISDQTKIIELMTKQKQFLQLENSKIIKSNQIREEQLQKMKSLKDMVFSLDAYIFQFQEVVNKGFRILEFYYQGQNALTSHLNECDQHGDEVNASYIKYIKNMTSVVEELENKLSQSYEHVRFLNDKTIEKKIHVDRVLGYNEELKACLKDIEAAIEEVSANLMQLDEIRAVLEADKREQFQLLEEEKMNLQTNCAVYEEKLQELKVKNQKMYEETTVYIERVQKQEKECRELKHECQSVIFRSIQYMNCVLEYRGLRDRKAYLLAAKNRKKAEVQQKNNEQKILVDEFNKLCKHYFKERDNAFTSSEENFQFPTCKNIKNGKGQIGNYWAPEELAAIETCIVQ